ncbi:hypothetical protein EV07_1891 [Prochlorococcus sp. MIT 0603]|nr:hypothetical protein EV07_1891 [Prochlorococcus sp. MIT 0603]
MKASASGYYFFSNYWLGAYIKRILSLFSYFFTTLFLIHFLL